MPRARAFDEDQVLTQAMMCFWKNGYTATSMKHLEVATELKPSSLYNSFGSKDELFLASLNHYFQQIMSRRIRSFLLESESPLDGVREFFSDCFTRDKDGPGMGCFMVNTSTELGPHQADVRERLLLAFREVNAGLTKALARAQAQGTLSETVDVKQRARHLGLLLNGMLVQSRVADKSLWLDDAMEALEAQLV